MIEVVGLRQSDITHVHDAWQLVSTQVFSKIITGILQVSKVLIFKKLRELSQLSIIVERLEDLESEFDERLLVLSRLRVIQA